MNATVQLWSHCCGNDVNNRDVGFVSTRTIITFSSGSSNAGYNPTCYEFNVFPFGNSTCVGFSDF